jgi:hypothetical protein
VIEEAVTKADDLLKFFKVQDRSLKKIQFNGKVAELRKSENIIDRTFLGTLVYKRLSFDMNNLNKLKFTDDMLKRFSSSLNIIKYDDGNNYAFYLNTELYLNIICFDNDGKIKQEMFNLLSGSNFSCLDKFKMVQTSSGFIIYLKLVNSANNSTRMICGQHVSEQVAISSYLIKIDCNFKYIHHKANISNSGLLHMAANKSTVLLIYTGYTYCYFDMNLVANSEKPLNAIKILVGKKIVDVQMSDKYLFFLCNDNKLKIFEIESGDFVKEIETSADQIKLAPADRIILFDSSKQVISLYEQINGSFNFDEFDLGQWLGTDLKINHDKTNTLAFYNSTGMTYTLLD